MSNFIWGNLTRTTADPTLIDGAISQAISAHNDDPDAHLGDTQSLQSHRGAEIIDHLAESVVNDKVRPNARAYTAIVDPESETDYSTISAAVEYVISKGGGTVLIRAGDHFISDQIVIPKGVNIMGEGIGVTVLYCAAGVLPSIEFSGAINEKTATSRLENLTLVRSSGQVFTKDSETQYYSNTIVFEYCAFEGGGTYSDTVRPDVSFRNCSFDVSGVALGVDGCSLHDCLFTTTNSGVSIGASIDGDGTSVLVCYDTVFDADLGVIISSIVKQSLFVNCQFGGMTSVIPGAADGCSENRYIGCRFVSRADMDLHIGGQVILITNSVFTSASYSATTAYVRLDNTTVNCLIVGNILIHDVKSDTGTNNTVSGNTLVFVASGPVAPQRKLTTVYTGATYSTALSLTGTLTIAGTAQNRCLVRNSTSSQFIAAYTSGASVSLSSKLTPTARSGTVFRSYRAGGRVILVEWSTLGVFDAFSLSDGAYVTDTLTLPPGAAHVYSMSETNDGQQFSVFTQASTSSPWSIKYYDYNHGAMTLSKTITGPSTIEAESAYYQRINTPWSIVMDSYLYALDSYKQRLLIYDITSGIARELLNVKSGAIFDTSSPCVSANGHVAVHDATNNEYYIYRRDGTSYTRLQDIVADDTDYSFTGGLSPFDNVLYATNPVTSAQQAFYVDDLSVRQMDVSGFNNTYIYDGTSMSGVAWSLAGTQVRKDSYTVSISEVQ